MNPTVPLFGAMSKERKPFTYTPGGLDLSEIKSERMARRLMRNAMNEGVPEVQLPLQSQPTSSANNNIPNYNCLPVQVFPDINLPANPKSLLRARSIPDETKRSLKPLQSNSIKYNCEVNSNKTVVKDTMSSLNSSNNSFTSIRPVSMYEFKTKNNNNLNEITKMCRNNTNTSVTPEIMYDAVYLQNEPVLRSDFKEKVLSMPSDILEKKTIYPIKLTNESVNVNFNVNNTGENGQFLENFMHSNEVTDENTNKEQLQFSNNEQRGVRLVKRVKKEKKIEETEKKTVAQNGETNNNTEITVKLQKKEPSGDPKTETQVDVAKKNLPDGTVEEVKTTTTKTTIDGKTEVKTKTERRKLPKGEAETPIKEANNKLESETVLQNGNNDIDTELVVKLPAKKTSVKTETKISIENKILPDGTVEETKTTTTTTTTDGKSEVKTKIDKRILSKEEADAVIEVEEEETDEIEKEIIESDDDAETENVEEENTNVNLIKNEEKSETVINKKIVVEQESQELTSDNSEEEEEVLDEEQEDEEEEESIVKPKSIKKDDSLNKVGNTEEVVKVEPDELCEFENEKEKDDDDEHEVSLVKNETEEEQNEKEQEQENEEHDDEDDEEEVENSEGSINEVKQQVKQQQTLVEHIESTEGEEIKSVDDNKSEKHQEKIHSENIEENINIRNSELLHSNKATENDHKEEVTENTINQPNHEKLINIQITEENIKLEKEQKEHIWQQKEPSVPLEKVEDIEIKPISSITKTHTENTEIIVNHEKPSGPISTQTEFNTYEKIETVNRTTKTLDHAYEQITQKGVPTMKTYFAPSRDRVTLSPAKAYQSSYTPEPQTERRHSLLLERISLDRQIPSDIYKNYQPNSQTLDPQSQWSQEPQSEVLSVSNVKPSTITKNQTWYQHENKENVIYNNVNPTTFNQSWLTTQYPTSAPKQILPEPQPQYEYKPSYVEITQNYSKPTLNTYKQSFPDYKPQTNISQNVPPKSQQNQYSFVDNDTTEYQTTSQQYTSSYVPPPWEQSPNYVPDSSQTCYLPSPQTNTFSPALDKSWKPPPQINKPSKPSTAYIPPAPNQSFVKTNLPMEPPKIPGRKTYYSEYERRFISVPDSMYVPGDNKVQHQHDPSPKYYYDSNEPSEPVEHEWRKELREFTEKTSISEYQTQHSTVRPPWEQDTKYPNIQPTQTPTWSQTVRPRTWKDKSYEAEYVGSQEVSKNQTNTLGRGRPLSSYTHSKVDHSFQQRPRGVSVDRYNPTSYHSPSEHPPVQSHTLTPGNAPHKTYHNPSVPAYHVRASDEIREQPGSYHQTRVWGGSRSSPIQSRSFKYLQWITGTDN